MHADFKTLYNDHDYTNSVHALDNIALKYTNFSKATTSRSTSLHSLIYN